MSLFDGLKAEIDKLNKAIQKDEKWVLQEISKGWQLLASIGHTIEVDIKGIFDYVHTHQSQILANLHTALGVLTTVGALVPGGQAASAVAAALAAVNAATAATNVLGNAIINGSTPLSTAVDAFHALKDAQTAVNAVVKHASAQPTLPTAAA